MSNKKHYYAPNHLNKEPFLHVWWLESGEPILYIQISEDEQNPIWMSYGNIVEMLSRKVPDFEKTILLDVITALRFNEAISAEIVKKHILG